MVDLQVRRLGRTEMKPKAFGLGCGYLGLPELTSEEEATATIREAIERGIDFIDTAPQYGMARASAASVWPWRVDGGKKCISKPRWVLIRAFFTIFQKKRHCGVWQTASNSFRRTMWIPC